MSAKVLPLPTSGLFACPALSTSSRHRVVPADTEEISAERNALQSPGIAVWKVKPSVGVWWGCVSSHPALTVTILCQKTSPIFILVNLVVPSVNLGLKSKQDPSCFFIFDAPGIWVCCLWRSSLGNRNSRGICPLGKQQLWWNWNSGGVAQEQAGVISPWEMAADSVRALPSHPWLIGSGGLDLHFHTLP